MDENGVEKLKRVGFASDGARNMTGKENGTAAKRVFRIYSNPLHCSSTSLSIKSGFQAIPCTHRVQKNSDCHLFLFQSLQFKTEHSTGSTECVR